jgi:hypothetical protein
MISSHGYPRQDSVLRTPDWFSWMIRIPESSRNLFASHLSLLGGTEEPLLHEVWWPIVRSFHIALLSTTTTYAAEFGPTTPALERKEDGVLWYPFSSYNWAAAKP